MQIPEERKEQHDEWLKKSNFAWERESDLKAKVAGAIATSVNNDMIFLLLFCSL